MLNAIVGTAGLGPTIVALTEGIDLALANKESLVVGGELVSALAEATGATILPVDSEHSAIFQLLRGERPGTVDRLILTASGGPFRGRRDLTGVTPERGARAPDLGDGRTDHDRLGDADEQGPRGDRGPSPVRRSRTRGSRCVVHPQSIVHSLVELNDGAQLAHLGLPDMRVPISYALHFPDRADVTVPALDLATVGSLTFEEPDLDTFPCLRWPARPGAAGGTAPCVLNAADEVAVAAFLAGEIPFTAIAEVIEGALAEFGDAARRATSRSCSSATPGLVRLAASLVERVRVRA